MYGIYVLGTAGSGKSMLTKSMEYFLTLKEIPCITVNLDPGARNLPYSPTIDVRDYITLEEVMRKYNLGPNGGLIAAIDLLINYIDSIKEEILAFDAQFAIIDTPGQMELFAFRSTGPRVISCIADEIPSSAIFLIDGLLSVESPSNFVSSLLLGLSVRLRIPLPTVYAISKVDLLSENDIEKILMWSEDADNLLNELQLRESDSSVIELSTSLCMLLQNFYAVSQLIPISSETFEGFNELIGTIEQLLLGGEERE
ncbi:GTPase [archaeon]|nr:MAG: GTPase [archaeon]RLG65996.1 MAG: GTPase [archaeon]HDM23974.1 GTPase [Candidatus Bathyarchaeota archaeon]